MIRLRNISLVLLLLVGLLAGLFYSPVARAADPEPVVEQQEPSAEQPKPSAEQPKPSAEQPKPSAEQQQDAPTDEEPTCELILRGEPIETLEFDWFSPTNYKSYTEQGIHSNEKSLYKEYKLASPKGVIKLPQGGCEVKKLTLKNGMECYDYFCFRFEVTPEKPFELVIEDLSCEVIAERIGPFINFNLKGPLDSQERKYHGTEKVKPSYFVSYQGKEITSGTLEYG